MESRTPLQVEDGVNREVARLVKWSLECASRGVAPEVGFYGEEFKKNSYRASLAGQDICNGYKCLG